MVAILGVGMVVSVGVCRVATIVTLDVNTVAAFVTFDVCMIVTVSFCMVVMIDVCMVSNCMFYQLLRVQHSCSSTQSWGSVLPSIVETRDQNSRGCPRFFSNRNLGSFCA